MTVLIGSFAPFAAHGIHARRIGCSHISPRNLPSLSPLPYLSSNYCILCAVTLPQPVNICDHPIAKRFESDVINFIDEIDDLQGKIPFEALSLHRSNGCVYSKSLSTPHLPSLCLSGLALAKTVSPLASGFNTSHLKGLAASTPECNSLLVLF
ncbi:hypothetical protein P691DRAFT_518972 [Macrolepiota fuliginosa MF-IS2]|uniref:Uncharacterized protein n=1 Tax=Macrolepiota fuliginosa MF-IS2 TaxID=1400762 RepID=A0A9P5X289_9AGAR|nr:hypothetical protein P691DRAFT_589315 [Macrolepiota fuliginosa MF-IS2]KAF9441965.1 hypothetical protein P691DRAFT_518972 [Macrolepiota fuliginosa MF-IS2]